MDKPHKQAITTYPVALKYGQGRIHISNPIPWHARSEFVKCPDCEVIFVVTEKFPMEQLLETLAKQHKNREEHPDMIPSAPEWTRTGDCDCQR